MTNQELIDAVIAQLKSEGSDISGNTPVTTPSELSVLVGVKTGTTVLTHVSKQVVLTPSNIVQGTGSGVVSVMSQAAVTNALSGKADASGVYTKSESDALLRNKADASALATKADVNGSSSEPFEALMLSLLESNYGHIDLFGGTASSGNQPRLRIESTENGDYGIDLDLPLASKNAKVATSEDVSTLSGSVSSLATAVDSLTTQLGNKADASSVSGKADKNGSASEPFATSELRLATSPGVTADIHLAGQYSPGESLPNSINIEIQDPLGELSPRSVKLEVPDAEDNDTIALQSGVNAVSNAVSALAASVPTQMWVQMCVGLGATYDESTGLFGLNGLTDLTLSEMKTIYRCTHDYRPGYDMASMLSPKYTATGSPIKFRTNFCNSRMLYRDENDAVNMHYFANGNSLLEVCVLYRDNLASARLRSRLLQNAFNGCTALREIVGVISLALITNRGLLADAFNGCAALESVDLVGLNCAAVGRYASISFADSPALSMESIAYMINNAGTAAGIVIQLHNTAYNNAKQSAAVANALAAKTNVTLINADNTYKWCSNTEYHNTGSEVWERYATCLVNSLDGSVVWTQIGPINSGGEQQSGQIG